MGLKLPLVLDWPIPPGGWLPFAQKIEELQALRALHLACAAALLLPRCRSRRSCARSSWRSCSGRWRSTSRRPCTTTSRRWSCSSSWRLPRHATTSPRARPLTAVPALGRRLLDPARSGSLALVNNYWLSLGLLCVLVSWLVALHLRAATARSGGSRARTDPGSRGVHEHVYPRLAARSQLEGQAPRARAPAAGTRRRDDTRGAVPTPMASH